MREPGRGNRERWGLRLNGEQCSRCLEGALFRFIIFTWETSPQLLDFTAFQEK